MSPEAQRIAIAEACGWYEIHYYGTEHNGPESDICPPRLVGTRSKWGAGKWGVIHSVPKYVNDLNAMHEAEKVLSWKDEGPSTSERRRYLMNLEAVISGPTDRFGDRPDRTSSVPFATAAQRAEAFLRTVGKWQD